MANRPADIPSVIDPRKYGVSFSVKQCRNFGLDPSETLDWLLAQGWRRFRLMSYWDEHEKKRGIYDFKELDKQVKVIEKAGGTFALCLGVKQPRWPEYHWPAWALGLTKPDRDTALLGYVEQVVLRYRGNSGLAMYQLENEALLKGFGNNIEIDRNRLRREYALVRELDPPHVIAMSTSNGWGIPVHTPRPDAVGFSYYPIMYKDGRYRQTIQKPRLHKLRKFIIENVLSRPVFIHELQCEPWGPTAIWKMSEEEQNKSMSPGRLTSNIAQAKQIGAHPIDLWGGEWWYWRSLQKDATIWNTVAAQLSDARNAKTAPEGSRPAMG
jgi:hypothetical protein